MAKKPTTKDCIKFVCDGLDTINDNIKKQRLELTEQNRINKERLEFEKKTKDRVDISLNEYEEMKHKIENLTAQNERYSYLLDKIGVNFIDSIEPSTIQVSTMQDPIRLSTRVHIQFECKKFNTYD